MRADAGYMVMDRMISNFEIEIMVKGSWNQ
jgi:hypothetical protein